MKLVVVLVLDLTRRGSPLKSIQTKIHQIPQKLSQLYEELLTSMPEDDMQDSLRLMQWIHYGLRPLSLGELRTAIAVDAISSSGSVDDYQQTEYYVETDEAMERRVCDLSRGLAGLVQHGKDKVVQFIHHSVADFLVHEGFDLLDRSQRSGTADTFAGRSHFQLSDVCIRYLASLRWKHDLDLDFPLLEYSLVYWIKHAQKYERENLSASHLLSYFDASGVLEFWQRWFRIFEPHKVQGLNWPTTIVHIASRYNLVRALDSLLSQSANVNLKNGDGETPLLIAAQRGHEEVVKLLLERIEVNADSMDKDNQSPLSYAAAGGHEKIVKLLLDRNDVKADAKDLYNRSPLSYAAEQGYETVVELLLKRNDVKANSRDKTNRSPLSYAARRGHQKVVELLLKRDDITVDWVDACGRTPLSEASQLGNEGVVRLLIERGYADVNSKDSKGKTPFWYANQRGHEGIVKLLKQRLSEE